MCLRFANRGYTHPNKTLGLLDQIASSPCHPAVVGAPRESAMKISVVVDELVFVVAIELTKPIECFQFLVGCVLYRLRDAREFERLAKRKDLVGIPQGHRRYAIPLTRNDDHQSFADEMLKRLAHRRLADVELLGELLLAQFTAGRQIACQNPPPQKIVDPLSLHFACGHPSSKNVRYHKLTPFPLRSSS